MKQSGLPVGDSIFFSESPKTFPSFQDSLPSARRFAHLQDILAHQVPALSRAAASVDAAPPAQGRVLPEALRSPLSALQNRLLVSSRASPAPGPHPTGPRHFCPHERFPSACQSCTSHRAQDKSVQKAEPEGQSICGMQFLLLAGTVLSSRSS